MKLCTFVPFDPVASRSSSEASSRLGALHPSAPDQVVDLLNAAQQSWGAVGVDSPLTVSGGNASRNATINPPTPTELHWFTSMQSWLEGGELARVLAQKLLDGTDPKNKTLLKPLRDLQLLAPLPRPMSIRDCMAYRQHFLQGMQGGARLKFPSIAKLDKLLRRVSFPLIRVPKLFAEIPAYYKGNPATVVGPNALVPWPRYASRLDYELEIGLYIGKRGRDISPVDATSYVAGYTIFNDVSARDTQLREMDLRLGPAKGKDFDGGNVMGPYLVTPDEIPDPLNLEAQARVNGEVWSRTSTRGIEFSIAQIISYISQSETVYPGDFIGLGTLPNGCGLEHGRWLQPGDEVELEVSSLGLLRCQVGAKSSN